MCFEYYLYTKEMNYCKKSKWEGLKNFFLFGGRICGMYDATVLPQEHQSGRCGCFRPVWLRMAVFLPRKYPEIGFFRLCLHLFTVYGNELVHKLLCSEMMAFTCFTACLTYFQAFWRLIVRFPTKSAIEKCFVLCV